MKRAQKTLPRVEDYVHYRRFLKDTYETRKRLDPSFSYGSFAKKAGVARSHLKGVLDGKRNLTPASLRRYVKGLGLSDEEGEYFEFLVGADQAKGPLERRAAISRLRELQGKRLLHIDPGPTSGPQGIFWQWARPLVLTLAKVRGFRADPEWISARLGGHVSPDEAREALNYLGAKGYLRIRGDRAVPAITKNLHRMRVPPEDIQAWSRRLYRVAAESLPRPQSDMIHATGLILTEPMVRRLIERNNEWIKEVMILNPGKGKAAPEGDLYVALCDLIPLKPIRKA